MRKGARFHPVTGTLDQDDAHRQLRRGGRAQAQAQAGRLRRRPWILVGLMELQELAERIFHPKSMVNNRNIAFVGKVAGL